MHCAHWHVAKRLQRIEISMPLSNQKLESLLRKSGCKFSFDTANEWFCARFHTKLFRNSKGESQLDLIVKLVEDGAFIRFLCPEIYSLKDCKFKGAAFEAKEK